MLLAIVCTCLLGLGSVLASIWFALTTDSDAAAINVSGSLRMQSYRLSDQVVVPEFMDRFTLNALIQTYDESITHPYLASLADEGGELQQRYLSLLDEWQSRMRPLLEHQATHRAFVANVPGFVEQIDHLVNALQVNTERKLQLLFMTALVSLCGILIIGIVSIRFLRLNLLNPIEDLSKAAQLASQGQFRKVSLEYEGQNEIGQLTQTFANMSEDLSLLYNHLEEQVSRQTQSLEQSNTALELLYDASQTLGMNPYDELKLQQLLLSWKSLLDLSSCHVCLTGNPGGEHLKRIYPRSDQYNPVCQKGDCSQCLIKGDPQWRFPLTLKDKSFGFLEVATVSGEPLSEESRQWLRTFSDIVATSLYRSTHQTQEQRLLLMEERAVIARELHDSLAQALSYQKIQVARLRRQLNRLELEEPVEVVNELKEGINNAYIQLRELLNTFRLSMAEGSLEEALQATLEEYRQRAGSISFELDYQLRFCPLNAHHQIHSLQIVREALVNVIQHASATRAIVRCLHCQDGKVVIQVDDDGCGFADSIKKSSHYGTTIMEERAASLGGNLAFSESPLGGARINLEYEVGQS